jgi:hypothetical protein
MIFFVGMDVVGLLFGIALVVVDKMKGNRIQIFFVVV